MKGWRATDWSTVQSGSTMANYLGAYAELSPGYQGSGGYFVRARNSTQRWATSEMPYEFAGFNPACPIVDNVNLVLSIPKRLRGPGLLAAFRMATDFPLYHGFASQIIDRQGALQDLVAPWGRELEYKTLRSEMLSEEQFRGMQGFAANWPGNDLQIVRTIVDRYIPTSDRDVFIVTDPDPPSLATLLIFWPLPRHR
jgi:hypothetical protein